MKLHIEYFVLNKLYKIDNDIDKNIAYDDENLGLLIEKADDRISLLG